MKNNKYQNRQKGFTLIELMIVVVIIAILAAVAVIYGPAYIKGTKDKLAQTRLAAIADAQSRFKAMGRGRYASVCELATTMTEDGTPLVPSSIAKFKETTCVPLPVNGWYVYDDIGENDPAQDATLRKTFLIHLQAEDSKVKKYCVGPDGILRKPEGRGRGSECSLNSPEAEN